MVPVWEAEALLAQNIKHPSLSLLEFEKNNFL